MAIVRPARHRNDAELIKRLALLTRERVDLAHPTKPGLRIIGYAVEADEASYPGEGQLLLGALERAGRVRLRELRSELLSGAALPDTPGDLKRPVKAKR